MGATPGKIQHPKKRAFLAAYANSANIRAACKAANINRSTYYDWMERDEAFALAAEQAKQDYGDLLEAELTSQAVQQHNTTALIVALKMAGRFVDGQHIFLHQDARREAKRLAEQYGLDADDLIREAERIANGRA